MADSFSWFKLWLAAITDQDLDNLEIGDFGRWAKLGPYIKAHGTNGSIVLPAPAKVLCAMLQVPDFEALQVALHRLPGLEIMHGKVTVTDQRYISVTFRNWHKWQGDVSRERVRKFREMKRPRGEQSRGELTNPPLSPRRGDVTSIGQILKTKT